MTPRHIMASVSSSGRVHLLDEECWCFPTRHLGDHGELVIAHRTDRDFRELRRMLMEDADLYAKQEEEEEA